MTAVILLSVTFGLAGCDEETDAPEGELVRSIKYMTLDQRAGEQERRIAGQVVAEQSSNVAFETAGQVVSLLRQPGEAVAEGDLLAQLDAEPYRLQLAQAENELAQALANLDDAQKKFDQTARLRQQGYATQTAFDTAEATLKNAKGAVGVAQSQQDLARRNLDKTDLKAPFSGVIARKLVDAFEEVAGGQAVFAIQSAGEGKIEAALPETLVNIVSLGTEVSVTFPPLGGVSVEGQISEISPLAGDANAYPIEINLARTPPGLRAGMSAEIIFSFESAETGKAFVVPLSAILPNPAPGGEAHVFVFNADTQTLTKRSVKVVNVRDNSLQVVGDLASGEVIATAGLSFLHDGIRVELFDPSRFQ